MKQRRGRRCREGDEQGEAGMLRATSGDRRAAMILEGVAWASKAARRESARADKANLRVRSRRI